jgi:two-component system, OmpR family, response regulator
LKTFGWVSPQRDPPERWDLRRLGWRLCRGRGGRRAECRHVLIVDVRGLEAAVARELAEADRPAWRLLLIGVEQPADRARLLTAGCAEAMPSSIGLRELEARARRVDDMFGMLPRWRTIGPLTLDLFHRDARRGGRWLALHPREFGVLWRLADSPGERVTRKQLLTDVWRLNHQPETNSVEVHVSRLRAKLAGFGCKRVVLTDPCGGYRLAQPAPPMSAHDPPVEDALDACLRRHVLRPLETAVSAGR